MTRTRLDVLLVDRGLAASRPRARALILAGHVRVPNVPTPKAGTLVDPAAEVTVVVPDHPYVGRGGVKLAHALDVFGIQVEGRTALDIGASTGGFTDVLLRRGARLVVAIDVGHGQLDWRLRQDPRVVVLERVNARSLTHSDLPRDAGPAHVVTLDVSFISVRLILPVLPALVAPHADVIALVKPQFEAGRDEVGPGGIVSDPAVHERVVRDVADAARRIGFDVAGETASPITGVEGNREFFLHLRARGGDDVP